MSQCASQLSLDNPESALSRMQLMLQEQHKQTLEATNQLSSSLNLAVSQLQVRKPLNPSGIGAWKRYERHLGPMVDALVKFGVLRRAEPPQ